jgi:hypothetical protein
MNNDLEQYYAEILNIYKALGYPQDLISQWTLPLRDAQTLMGIIQDCRPHNILEVGTFVGMTTLLLALFSSPETHIHSIDPNFPLEVEMGSMGSELYDYDTSIKAQDLGLQAAERLRVDKKISFHAGGFSSGNTFASYNQSPSSRINIIGPEICNKFGPFDFIFIDGLHYEEDVFSDLNLAVEHLAPSGALALHDVLGGWGSNVRRAVFRFLEKHADYSFSHARYADIYNSIGLLQRFPQDQGHLPHENDIDVKNNGLIQEKMFPNFAAVLIHIFSPASVVQIGGNIGLIEQLKDYGVPEVSALTFPDREIQQISVPIKQFNLHEKNYFEKKYDLCICLEALDSLSDESLDNIIQACVDASNSVIFACTPPGELGTALHKDMLLTYWIKKFYEKGYLFYDIIRPILEPITSSDTIYQERQYNSSYLMNLYLVRRDDRLETNQVPKSFLEEIVISKEMRIEDLHLQNLYQKNIKNHYKMIADQYMKEYERTLATINIFNRIVLDNTWKRIKEIYSNMLTHIRKNVLISFE